MTVWMLVRSREMHLHAYLEMQRGSIHFPAFFPLSSLFQVHTPSPPDPPQLINTSLLHTCSPFPRVRLLHKICHFAFVHSSLLCVHGLWNVCTWALAILPAFLCPACLSTVKVYRPWTDLWTLIICLGPCLVSKEMAYRPLTHYPILVIV